MKVDLVKGLLQNRLKGIVTMWESNGRHIMKYVLILNKYLYSFDKKNEGCKKNYPLRWTKVEDVIKLKWQSEILPKKM